MLCLYLLYGEKNKESKLQMPQLHEVFFLFLLPMLPASFFFSVNAT